MSEYQKRWYQHNLERERTKRREYASKWRKRNPELKLWCAAKERAKVKNLDFNIEIDDIVIPDVCPILNQPLLSKTPYAASLDRIDNSLGYIKGNVWIISKRANAMKNDATEQDLQEFMKWLIKR